MAVTGWKPLTYIIYKEYKKYITNDIHSTCFFYSKIRTFLDLIFIIVYIFFIRSKIP